MVRVVRVAEAGSSSGAYWQRLDHVRAVAAFMVFVHHFVINGPAPPEAQPAAPLVLLVEGHTGVSLFMVLSGYLFARLAAGRRLRFGAFVWNRALRLFPLLIFVCLLGAWAEWRAGRLDAGYWGLWLRGFVTPEWPMGAWSVAVELQFYLLLPAILWVCAGRPLAVVWLIVGVWVMRAVADLAGLSLHGFAYMTLLGRIDQFLLGIAAAGLGARMAGRHGVALAVATGFALGWWGLDGIGALDGAEPGLQYRLMAEGVVYALLVAWYDRSFGSGQGWIAVAVAHVGRWAYSIYLMQQLFITDMHVRLARLGVVWADVPGQVALATLCFVLFLPVAFAAHVLLERPARRFRRPYLLIPATVTKAS